MKVFLDANIIVSVVNKEYPVFSLSSRILSLTRRQGFEVCTSPLCLAIAFYFAEKKNKKTAREKLDLLVENISVTAIDANVVKKASEDKRIRDFEDGLEYYSALYDQCDCIITEDVGDFFFSKLPVWNCESFIQHQFSR